MSTIATWLRTAIGVVVLVLALPYLLIVGYLGRRDPRQYGRTQADRDFEIARKFGPASLAHVNELLSHVRDPDDQVLGAIVFVARTVDGVEWCVKQANEDRPGLLRTAVVMDERT